MHNNVKLINLRSPGPDTALQVCPTGLHISLGIFYRLFTLLEDACHELAVLNTLQLQGSDSGATYKRYATALKQQSTLRDNIATVKAQATNLEQLLTLTLLNVPPGASQTTLVQQLTQNIAEKKGRVKEMVNRECLVNIRDTLNPHFRS